MKIGSALASILCALALGAFSTILFVWQWLVGPPTRSFATILFLAVGAAFLMLLLYLQRRVPKPSIQSERPRSFRGLPVICGALAIGYVALSTVQHVKMLPHGAWDAFAVWNVHARFLYRGSAGLWREIFGPAMSGSQRDYPLLLPGLISGAWTIAGTGSPLIPAVLAIAFAALSVGIVCSAVSALATDERGLLAGLLLLATPGFLLTAAFQAADIPIALYILTTAVLLQFAEAWPEIKRPMLVLAGLSAGFAAWTKNEGLLFVVAVFGSYVVSFAALRAWKPLRDNLMAIAMGLAPMLILILGFKALLAFNKTPIESLAYVASPARYSQILSGFYDEAKGFGGTWHTGGVHPFVLVAIFLLIYVTPIGKINATSLSLVLLIVFMLGGYVLVYLFSSYGSVGGYIANSLGRLYLQLWPACLFIMSTVSLPAATGGSKE
jgi:hypothetical protein